MKRIHTKTPNRGFTLIELLIVIGLLGALTALVLPSLTADREEALGSICDYNQAGTVRTLRQFASMMGHYPNQFHTGLYTETATTKGAVGSTGVMPGLPGAQKSNIGPDATEASITLDSNQIDSLVAAGISKLCYGDGYNVTDLTSGTSKVISVQSTWVDDSDSAYTFDGIPVHTSISGQKSWTDEDADGTEEGDVIALWITPTLDWEASTEANKDWSGGNVQMEIALEGKCPIPATTIETDGEVTFAYYVAFFKVYDDGSAAKLVGSTCPECGIMNP